MKYKILMHYPDGIDEEPDEVYATEEDAVEAALDAIGCYSVGCEVLHLSNPGDYPLIDDSDEIEFEIIEIDEAVSEQNAKSGRKRRGGNS